MMAFFKEFIVSVLATPLSTVIIVSVHIPTTCTIYACYLQSPALPTNKQSKHHFVKTNKHFPPPYFFPP